MKSSTLLNAIAATDSTFHREGRDGIGRCLIGNGPLRFDTETGAGATVEHIVSRGRGGGCDLRNLGVTHPRCYGEKDIYRDGGRHGRRQSVRYEMLIAASLARRGERWRDAAASAGKEY